MKNIDLICEKFFKITKEAFPGDEKSLNEIPLKYLDLILNSDDKNDLIQKKVAQAYYKDLVFNKVDFKDAEKYLKKYRDEKKLPQIKTRKKKSIKPISSFRPKFAEVNHKLSQLKSLSSSKSIFSIYVLC